MYTKYIKYFTIIYIKCTYFDTIIRIYCFDDLYVSINIFTSRHKCIDICLILQHIPSLRTLKVPFLIN